MYNNNISFIQNPAPLVYMLIISIAHEFLPVALPGRWGGMLIVISRRFDQEELHIFNMLRNVLRPDNAIDHLVTVPKNADER